MGQKPVIGISPSQSDGFIRMRANYAEAILDNGGIPVFLPYTNDKSRIDCYVNDLDGLLFAGGVDVDPRYYGETVRFDSVEINKARDDFELALFPAFFSSGKPIFGICRGIQLINVALGGSLFQHIDGHAQAEDKYTFIRTVKVAPGTLLSKITESPELLTNSWHHQAVNKPAPGLRVCALAEDGTVEAVEHTSHPFLLAVQWHPEMYYRSDKNASGLFSAFVSSAADNR